MPRLCTLLTPVAIAPAVWRQDPLCLASPHLLPSDFTTSPPAQTRVTMIFLADDATQDPRRRMSSLYSKAQREARRSSSSVRLPPRLPAVQGDRLEGGLPRGSSDGDTVLTIQTKHTLRYVVWVRLGWGKQMVAGIQRTQHPQNASHFDFAYASWSWRTLRLPAASISGRRLLAFRGETLCISTLEGDEEEIVRMLREALSSSHVRMMSGFIERRGEIHGQLRPDCPLVFSPSRRGHFLSAPLPFTRSGLTRQVPLSPSSPLSRSLAGHGPLSTSSNAAIETCSWSLDCASTVTARLCWCNRGQDDAVVHAQQDEANALDIFPPRDEGGWDVGRDESDRVAAGLVDDATFVVGIPHQPARRACTSGDPSLPDLFVAVLPCPPLFALAPRVSPSPYPCWVEATGRGSWRRMTTVGTLGWNGGLASYAATVEEWVIANDKGDNARIPGTKTPSTLPASSMVRRVRLIPRFVLPYTPRRRVKIDWRRMPQIQRQRRCGRRSRLAVRGWDTEVGRRTRGRWGSVWAQGCGLREECVGVGYDCSKRSGTYDAIAGDAQQLSALLLHPSQKPPSEHGPPHEPPGTTLNDRHEGVGEDSSAVQRVPKLSKNAIRSLGEQEYCIKPEEMIVQSNTSGSATRKSTASTTSVEEKSRTKVRDKSRLTGPLSLRRYSEHRPTR
ncbi:hypothetical protein C8R45DRAFT_946705 [Mycena sanguinolenta]|nr:hypothetical protein C8R45DRAFT_946705 [Mycena sanguinolenta]